MNDEEGIYLEVVSDGTPLGTVVQDMGSGQPVRNIKQIDIHADADSDQITCTLTLIPTSLDLTNVEVRLVEMTELPHE